MTFHETFWLATAAAAPVIALAAVVALPDTSGLYGNHAQRLEGEYKDLSAKLRPSIAGDTSGLAGLLVAAMGVSVDMRDRMVGQAVKSYRVMAWVVRLAAIVNMLLQAGLLATSLVALAYNLDVMPPWVAIVLAVGGILLLAATVSAVPAYRNMTEHFSERLLNAYKRAGDEGEQAAKQSAHGEDNT